MPFGSRNGGVVDRIWLEHYPRGVPAEIDVNEYASAREVFEESCRKFATRPAFSCMGRSISFADLDALSSTFGAWLQHQGCAKGTRVALMMPNILQYPVCLFGALSAGQMRPLRGDAVPERFYEREPLIARELVEAEGGVTLDAADRAAHQLRGLG